MTSRRTTARSRPSTTSGDDCWEPYQYQKVALKFALEHPECALYLEPGLGKTTVALADFQMLQRHRAVRRALVIAPLRPCYLVWSHDESGELTKWRQFRDIHEVVLHGSHKEELLTENADLYVINPDGLEWLTSCRKCDHPTHTGKCGEKGCDCRAKDDSPIEDLFRRGVDMLIIDELSKFKHVKTLRFRCLKDHLPRFKRRLGLTGSPASNGLLDLFGQAYAVDLGKSLGKFISHYRFRYFMPTGYMGYKWVPKPGAEEEIFQAMKDVAISMKAADHLDLPDLMEVDLRVNLPDKARDFYDDLETELIALIDSTEVTAANAAVASMKCRQVASGGIYLQGEDARVARQIHDAKTEALVDLVDELQGQPLLVAYEFQHDLDRIRAALGEDVPAIGGGVSMKRVSEIVRAWNAGEIPVLCGHPQAMGHGLNLQAAGNHVCWYTVTWDFELYDQLIRRIWRQGNSHERVFVHRLIARKTVDEAVIRALKSKKRGQDALFAALKATLKRAA